MFFKAVFKSVCAVTMFGLLAGAAAAQEVPREVRGEFNAIENNLKQIINRSQKLPASQRMAVVQHLLALTEKVGAAAEAATPILAGGRDGWYQAVGEDCRQFCPVFGMESVLSPEGAQCSSGETVPASSVGALQFVHGCWPNCAPRPVSTAASVGRFCYNQGQKRDNDRTDITVGCFCQ